MSSREGSHRLQVDVATADASLIAWFGRADTEKCACHDCGTQQAWEGSRHVVAGRETESRLAEREVAHEVAQAVGTNAPT